MVVGGGKLTAEPVYRPGTVMGLQQNFRIVELACDSEEVLAIVFCPRVREMRGESLLHPVVLSTGICRGLGRQLR
jgi:hypothetical protein